MGDVGQKPDALLCCLQRSSFVEDDIALLRERYTVHVHEMGTGHTGLQLVWHWLKQVVWLVRHLPTARFVVGWFADYHLFFPTLLAKLTQVDRYVMLGGFDCNVLPEYGYGVYLSGWRAPLARYVVRHANVLCPVADALMASAPRFNGDGEPRPNGLREHVPSLSTPVRVIGTGYDPQRWPMGVGDRSVSVLTVAAVNDERTMYVKGLDVFLDVASVLREVRFTAVGISPGFEAQLRAAGLISENVTVEPFMPRDELVRLYQRHAVYAQLSRTEGLPNVLCEAMLCGCVPVGSDVGAIPEIIGDAGLIVPAPDRDAVAAALRQALGRAESPECRKEARKRIVLQYSQERRRGRLLNMLEASNAQSAT